MPVIALLAIALYAALAFGLRSWIQRRRTGSTGWRGLSGRPGSLPWFGGVLLVVGLAALAIAPLLDLAGVVGRSGAIDGPTAHALGLLLYAAGLLGTLWSQLAMGASWRIGVDEGERTALVTHGPFRLVRNPIFTAMIATAAGIALLVPGVPALSGVACLVIGLELHVRLVEEPYLRRTHDRRYATWAARTGRFVPGLGRLAD